ncbi:hypothetical protein PINS_up017112 [Pythium insidiosum]|nr:hypothetical protein PINS_up017112 [Pythium insidiosum]
MERFQIRRKISDTMLGAVYEGQLRHSQRRSSVALKCSSLAVANKLRAGTQKRRVDDPQREWAVVEQLIASGGHRHVVQCYDQFVSRVNSSAPPPNASRIDNQPEGTNGFDRQLHVPVQGHVQSRGQTQPQPHTLSQPQTESQTRMTTSKGIEESADSASDCDCDSMTVLISEFCRGGDLHALLEASPDGRLSERQALQFMLQIARGVQFLHGLGFAHRDLSLENVLLRNGVCKITDFALACRVDERSVECVGKDLYMAPEVVAMGEDTEEEEEYEGEEHGDDEEEHNGRSVTASNDHDDANADDDDDNGEAAARAIAGYDPAKADVWSMGVMLFVMLTGSRLVLLASPQDKSFVVVRAHGATALLSAWGVAQGLSSSTLRVLESMLQVDPARRASLLGVLRALEQIA